MIPIGKSIIWGLFLCDMNNRDSGQDPGQKKLRRIQFFAGMKEALKHKCFKASRGGDKRDRTADLLNAIGSREIPCSENAYF